MNIIHREEHLCDRLCKRRKLIRRCKLEFVEDANRVRLSDDEREELKRTMERNPQTAVGQVNCKSQKVLCEGNDVKYEFIRDHAERWPMVHQYQRTGVQCGIYYDWSDRPANVAPPQELALRRRMKVMFAASRDAWAVSSDNEAAARGT